MKTLALLAGAALVALPLAASAQDATTTTTSTTVTNAKPLPPPLASRPAFNALLLHITPAHARTITEIEESVNQGTVSPVAAAQQIDGILTKAEGTTIIAASGAQRPDADPGTILVRSGLQPPPPAH